MSLRENLIARSENACELCQSKNNLSVYSIPPDGGSNIENCLYVCDTCLNQLEKKEELNSKHWSCLSTSMWSDVPAVQVVVWRLLNRMQNETWAADLLDQLYLDDENLAWAKATGDHLDSESEDFHIDSNGVQLITGDTITLIKSLDVKGSQINAKIGTVVKNIRLVSDNTEQIEGKIEGQQIVILTKFVRKSS